eukprot:3334136-Amphidinium_carterae.1
MTLRHAWQLSITLVLHTLCTRVGPPKSSYESTTATHLWTVLTNTPSRKTTMIGTSPPEN